MPLPMGGHWVPSKREGLCVGHGLTLKLWSCVLACGCVSCLRQVLKMSSSVSLSQPFSSLMRSSSCLTMQLVWGDKATLGSCKGLQLPECSARIFYRDREDSPRSGGSVVQKALICYTVLDTYDWCCAVKGEKAYFWTPIFDECNEFIQD